MGVDADEDVGLSDELDALVLGTIASRAKVLHRHVDGSQLPDGEPSRSSVRFQVPKCRGNEYSMHRVSLMTRYPAAGNLSAGHVMEQ